MNIKSILTLTLFAALTTLAFAQKGVFTTEKGKLIDAEGREFVIRGINNPHAWFGEKAYTALDDIKHTGCNTVRIVWNTRGKDSDLERIIRRCIELEMIPMVELHDITGNTSADRLADMARWYAEPHRVAMLMKYERFLLLNIANEWGAHNTKADYWRSAYIRCIDIMRQSGYTTTIVVDAPGWGQNIDPIIECGQGVIDADPLHNILFSVHMYGSWNNPEKIRKKLTLCHQKELPLIVGEFGYNYAEGKNNLTCRVDHTVILDVCNSLGYGYMPWSWTGNNKENQWLDLVHPNDWNTLTWWGEQVISGKGGITETAKRASVFNTEYTRSQSEESVWDTPDMWYQSECPFDTAKIDVFYLVSTEVLSATDSLGKEVWQSPLSPSDRTSITGEIAWVGQNMYGKDFNIIAPYYHQLTFDAFTQLSQVKFDSIYNHVADEVCGAFDYYMKHNNHGRPFILAGFSQGAMLTLDILRHMTDEQYSRMIACYTLGYRLTEEDLQHPHIKAAKGKSDNGVVISFNSTQTQDAIWQLVSEGAATCINPVNWHTDATPAVFTFEKTTNVVHVDEASHVLIVTSDTPSYFDAFYDAAPFFLKAGVSRKNLHHWDLLFYASHIHDNALLRAKSARQVQP